MPSAKRAAVGVAVAVVALMTWHATLGGRAADARAPPRIASSLPAFYQGPWPPADAAARIFNAGSCRRYRAAVPPERRLVAPAGLLHAGTHLAAAVPPQVCRLPGGGAFGGEVPWGKHNPLDFRGVYSRAAAPPRDPGDVLPLVVIKDPLTWIQGLCDVAYVGTLSYSRAEKPPTPRCPKRNATDSWVPGTRVVVDYHDTAAAERTYPSLVHLWKEWYGAYMTDPRPNLIVRYEDLLFDPVATWTAVCECAGGAALPVPPAAFQPAVVKGYGRADDAAGYLALYGSEAERLGYWGARDFAFFREVAGEMLATFGYNSFPPTP
eukprot:TRINITY_DN33332_c0_g1_i1.p2 TRINITY_DN33332_c0_g1~~TRINITY_DN33332_c0_g1_i1.p2  ORF type:complete len:322 (+),score=90.09 TRINITY_DN33332_c0_g1_i1:167-1132(+)